MRHIFLTGRPGVGKTTVVQKLLPHLPLRAGGFYTRELREGGRRVGFEIVTLDGAVGVLAHVDFEGPCRVGRYGVNVADIDGVAVPALDRAMGECDLIVIDEVGTMELFSPRFQRCVRAALESGRLVLGIIKERGHPFIGEVRSRGDVRVIEVTPSNRDGLPELIAEELRRESALQGL